ncbi:unnamed protein product, partial [Vitis vinifera]|uniref:Uncharacterized protein n=1 Tax=Vitis vinifera TaxID=29760 RepID=D7TLW8_VITVI
MFQIRELKILQLLVCTISSEDYSGNSGGILSLYRIKYLVAMVLKGRLDHKGSSDYILRGFSKGCLLLGTSPKCAWLKSQDLAPINTGSAHRKRHVWLANNRPSKQRVGKT